MNCPLGVNARASVGSLALSTVNNTNEKPPNPSLKKKPPPILSLKPPPNLELQNLGRTKPDGKRGCIEGNGMSRQGERGLLLNRNITSEHPQSTSSERNKMRQHFARFDGCKSSGASHSAARAIAPAGSGRRRAWEEAKRVD